jgi:hypothetical protein
LDTFLDIDDASFGTFANDIYNKQTLILIDYPTIKTKFICVYIIYT